MTSSPPPSSGELVLITDADTSESQLSSLIFDLSQNVQATMHNMLKMTNEVDQNSGGIMEEIERCKESVFQRKKLLEEEREQCQKAAFAVLNMLNGQ